ncbi:MAG TPA: hypothetical protein VMV69_16490 [Pirellulales bacterium]|nr:hypothetical protein [Pirellulales bacterium]
MLKAVTAEQPGYYASREGVTWAALTNADHWRVYKVILGKRVEFELLLEFCISTLDPKAESTIEILYAICKEGWKKSALESLDEKHEALNRYLVGAIIRSKHFVGLIRRKLRQVHHGAKVDVDEILRLLDKDVLKLEVLGGEKAELAEKLVHKAAKKLARGKAAARASKTAEKKGSNEQAKTAKQPGGPAAL